MAERKPADFEAMSAAVERGDYQVGGEIEFHVELARGRPPGERMRGRNSPARSVRLPAELDRRLAAFAEDRCITPSEVVRAAVADYLVRHGGDAGAVIPARR
ncbi:CopG family transcriptional regulator [Tomitella fengzijianii]|uniref:Ribbon-helix-helix protein, CopG family n=1 Tax=Tomitella fengzijianii TaxID=2597660 RepID=A0A516X5S5_9ACTN|nr:CopG family transcriptional regulator [Tomitella fengzijianii]QDQ98373.1 ribbon-helix-helix protein, CopG family [Tomitella fengzijianii]